MDRRSPSSGWGSACRRTSMDLFAHTFFYLFQIHVTLFVCYLSIVEASCWIEVTFIHVYGRDGHRVNVS